MSRVASNAALCLVLGACAIQAPPTNPDDICSIYTQKRAWYRAAMRAQGHWGVPSCVPMAMMYQESSFRAHAKTRRTYALGFIPWGRVTSAYGYAQAVDGVWNEYRQARGMTRSRSDFGDALDFMDWYITNARKYAGIPLNDAYHQYVAYHDGIGAYKRERGVPGRAMRRAADRVARRAWRYQKQFNGCEAALRRRGWFSAFVDWLL